MFKKNQTNSLCIFEILLSWNGYFFNSKLGLHYEKDSVIVDMLPVFITIICPNRKVNVQH
jgi:hypothetical protein